MEGIIQVVRREVLRLLGEQYTTQVGYVTGYNPDTYQAKVMLQPWGNESAWLPIGSLGLGPHCGFYAPPVPGSEVAPGDQVRVICLNNLPAFVVCGGLRQGQGLPVPAGELWCFHRSGTGWKIDKTGTMTFLAGLSSIVMAPDGTITSTGEWVHTGDLTVTGVIHGTLG